MKSVDLLPAVLQNMTPNLMVEYDCGGKDGKLRSNAG